MGMERKTAMKKKKRQIYRLWGLNSKGQIAGAYWVVMFKANRDQSWNLNRWSYMCLSFVKSWLTTAPFYGLLQRLWHFRGNVVPCLKYHGSVSPLERYKQLHPVRCLATLPLKIEFPKIEWIEITELGNISIT